MMIVQLLCVLTAICPNAILGRLLYRDNYDDGNANPVVNKVTGDNVGDPLYLTPYIESGDILAGRNAAEVEPILDDEISYSGFLTVNKEYDSNIFFWFFRSEYKWENAPIIVWLQGGPGLSSLYGLLEENGPYYVNEYGLQGRNYSWTKEFNVLYLDNPIGTGYSFAKNENGYAKNQDDVAGDLYQAFVQFFELFPEFLTNDFYLAGESYAGKYVLSAAHLIHRNNFDNDVMTINLKGAVVGNGFVDPSNMLTYSDFLFELGALDQKETENVRELEELTRQSVRSGNYEEANDRWIDIMTYLEIACGVNLYDFTKFSSGFRHNDAFLQTDSFRKSIHVGSLPFDGGFLVNKKMKADIFKSVANLLPELLENYRILFYNGQFDVIVAKTTNFLQHLSWDGAYKYYESKWTPWHVGGDMVGYRKQTNNLSEVLIRNAGHITIADQPEWTYNMLTSFIKRES